MIWELEIPSWTKIEENKEEKKNRSDCQLPCLHHRTFKSALTLFVLLYLQVKKQQQAVVGFLEANRISFQQVDITMLEEQRLWMYRHIPRDKLPEKGNPLPPQIFNEDRYCGVRLVFFLRDASLTDCTIMFSIWKIIPLGDHMKDAIEVARLLQ